MSGVLGSRHLLHPVGVGEDLGDAADGVHQPPEELHRSGASGGFSRSPRGKTGHKPGPELSDTGPRRETGEPLGRDTAREERPALAPSFSFVVLP